MPCYLSEIITSSVVHRFFILVLFSALTVSLLAHLQLMCRSLDFFLSLQNIISHDMPKLSVFDLFRESDVEFQTRTGWIYSPQAPVYVPDPTFTIQSPLAGAGAQN